MIRGMPLTGFNIRIAHYLARRHQPGPAMRPEAQHEEVQAMTLDQLKSEHPDVYAAAKAEIEAAAMDRGVRQERVRQVAALGNVRPSASWTPQERATALRAGLTDEEIDKYGGCR